MLKEILCDYERVKEREKKGEIGYLIIKKEPWVGRLVTSLYTYHITFWSNSFDKYEISTENRSSISINISINMQSNKTG